MLTPSRRNTCTNLRNSSRHLTPTSLTSAATTAKTSALSSPTPKLPFSALTAPTSFAPPAVVELSSPSAPPGEERVTEYSSLRILWPYRPTHKADDLVSRHSRRRKTPFGPWPFTPNSADIRLVTRRSHASSCYCLIGNLKTKFLLFFCPIQDFHSISQSVSWTRKVDFTFLLI